MLDTDLAELYEVTTSALNQAVKRNAERFPEDFAFQLTQQEFTALISQTVTSNTGRGGRRKRPWAFTEHGVAMLSSVLRSPKAVQVNIEIMRAFVRLRRLLATPGGTVPGSVIQVVVIVARVVDDHRMAALAFVSHGDFAVVANGRGVGPTSGRPVVRRSIFHRPWGAAGRPVDAAGCSYRCRYLQSPG